ncbi:hypothetical protein J6590_043236, partial [Homalodisca vitripennis]
MNGVPLENIGINRAALRRDCCFVRCFSHLTRDRHLETQNVPTSREYLTGERVYCNSSPRPYMDVVPLQSKCGLRLATSLRAERFLSDT